MDAPDPLVLPVAEIRDYDRINEQVAHGLDAGHRHIRLSGVDGQRLLARGLVGRWTALLEVDGPAGPELAADLDAPGLVVVARAAVADGAGRGLRAGTLLIHGDAGDGTAYRQAGGLVVVAGATGNRAGLELAGGTLILLGRIGCLLADRQAGGRIIAVSAEIGPHPGHGRVGGRMVSPRSHQAGFDPPMLEDATVYAQAMRNLAHELGVDLATRSWPWDDSS